MSKGITSTAGTQDNDFNLYPPHEIKSKSIEEVLHEYYQKVFEHAYELGQEFPEDTNPKMLFDPCNAEDELKALKDIETIVNGVVGEDEKDYLRSETAYGHRLQSRNSLRAEIRTNFNKVLRSK